MVSVKGEIPKWVFFKKKVDCNIYQGGKRFSLGPGRSLEVSKSNSVEGTFVVDISGSGVRVTIDGQEHRNSGFNFKPGQMPIEIRSYGKTVKVC